MTASFNHLLHWVPDVARAVYEYNEAGLPAYSVAEPEWFNAEPRPGYIEVISIQYRASVFVATPFETDEPMTRAARSTVDSGGGALNFGVSVEDTAPIAERWRDLGFDVREYTVAPDGAPVAWRLATLTDGPQWAPFAVAYDPPRDKLFDVMAEQGTPLAPIWPYSPVIETPTPYSDADWLGQLLDLPVEGVIDLPRIDLPGCEIHFREGSAGRITSVALDALAGENVPAADVSGLTYRRAFEPV
jgi:hypothetical protein